MPPWLAAAAVVCLLSLVGCRLEPDRTLQQAATFFEPVGPLRLVQAMPPPEQKKPEAERADGGPEVPDSRIRLVLGMRLDRAELEVDELDIEVRDRVVTLRGRVGDPLDRDRAELIARSVEGVRDVQNGLEVASGP